MHRFVAGLILLALAAMLPAVAQAQQAACPATAEAMLQANTRLPTLQGTLLTPLVASDQPFTVHLLEDVDPTAQIHAAMNIPDAALSQDLRVLAWSQPQDPTVKGSDLVLAPIGTQGLNVLSFPRFTLAVVQCGDGKLIRSLETSGHLSFRVTAVVAALAFTLLAYCLGALAARHGKGWARLNPINLTIDGSGRASLSQMQILFFSVIVLFLVTYILLRTGVLANLSDQVLLLLGIAGAGSVGGTVATASRHRISFENWAWAKKKGWTGPTGYTVVDPSWSDLISTGGDFDPYRFQMLTFSIVVGMALLLLGVNGLASFSIPTALLGVLGLSQVTYIGGKIVSGGSFGDLDAKLTALQKAEAEFVATTATAWLDPTPPGDALKTAIAQDRAGYMKFKAQAGPAWIMFKELFASVGPTPQFDPSP